MGYRNTPSKPRSKDASATRFLPFEQPKYFRIKRRSKLGGGLIFPTQDHHAPHFASFKDCVEYAVKHNISLRGADLTDPYDGYTEKEGKIDLSNGVYNRGDFRDVLMTGVMWCNSSCVGANFSGTSSYKDIHRSGYSLHTTEGENCDFSGCNLKHTRFNKAILNHSKFGMFHDKANNTDIPCRIEEATFKEARAHSVRFTNAKANEKTVFESIDAYGSTFTLMDMTVIKDFPIRSGAVFFDCQLTPALENEMRARYPQPKRLTL